MPSSEGSLGLPGWDLTPPLIERPSLSEGLLKNATSCWNEDGRKMEKEVGREGEENDECVRILYSQKSINQGSRMKLSESRQW